MSRPVTVSAEGVTGTERERPLEAARLLLSGSHAVLLAALAEQLQWHGASVVATCHRLEEINGLFVAHRPDVCVVEDRTDDVDLATVTARLRNTDPAVKVVVISNRKDRGLEQPVRRGLLDGVVSRGCRLPLLVDALEKVLAGQSVTVTTADLAFGARDKCLSQREEDVLRLLAGGATNAEISQELGISVNTVRAHVHSLLHKLDVRQRFQAGAASPYPQRSGASLR